MGDTKLSALTELAATPASDDEVYIRDVSEEPASESKRITIAHLGASSGGGISYIAVLADTEWHNNDTARSLIAPYTYTKKKETKLDYDMTNLRIKFDLKAWNSGASAYGKVYKNGAAIGAQRTTASTTYVTFSEDFADFVAGDLVQVYLKGGNEGQGWPVYVANFTLCCELAYPAPTDQDP